MAATLAGQMELLCQQRFCSKASCRVLRCHADRITPLGKRPTIASLSLGATRTFRLRRAATADDTETPEQKQQQQQQQGAAKSGEEEGAGTSTSGVDIQLEHNTLLVMWPAHAGGVAP